MNRLFLFGIAIVVGLAFSQPAHAQYRNQGIQGNVGYLGLGSLWEAALGPVWNMHDQPTLGAGHTLALGYNLWFDNTVAIGGGVIKISAADQLEPVFSLNISTGLRYQFLEEKFRPFISGHIHYLQIIPATEAPPVPTNGFLGSAPFWVGGRFGGGAEYFFADEMSLMAELTLAAFFGLNTPPCIPTGGGSCEVIGQQSFILPATVARVSVFVYF
jgi:hypothetical protein